MADGDDVVPVAGDSGADPDEVVPIAGDSTGPVAPPAGSERPFVSNAPWDSSGYEGLSAATDELGANWPLGPPPPTTDPVADDVVPIQGDSHPTGDDDAMFGTDGSYVGASGPEPPPAPTSATAPATDIVGDEVDAAIDEVMDRVVGPEEEGLLPRPRTRPRNPWLIAALVTAAVLLAAAVIGLAVSHRSSSHSAASTSTTSAGASTSSRAATSSSAATTIPASDVTLTLSLGQVSGNDLPLLIAVQAAGAAPHALTVKVTMTGPGVPATDTYVVEPGTTVTHTVVGHGCGSWSVKVVSIDGQPVVDGSDPDLQNGATHAC